MAPNFNLQMTKYLYLNNIEQVKATIFLEVDLCCVSLTTQPLLSQNTK